MFFMAFLFQEKRGLVEFSKVSELTSSRAMIEFQPVYILFMFNYRNQNKEGDSMPLEEFHP